MRPVVSRSGKRAPVRSSVGMNSVSMKRPLPRTNRSTCMTGVPSGAAALQGHCSEPMVSSLSYDTPVKLGVRRAISSMTCDGCVYCMGYPNASEKRSVTSQSARPASGCMTLRTRLMRRSALVKVPSFSKNDDPGKNTCAYMAVSFKNRSCTTTHSMARRPATTCCVSGSDCAISSP